MDQGSYTIDGVTYTNQLTNNSSVKIVKPVETNFVLPDSLYIFKLNTQNTPDLYKLVSQPAIISTPDGINQVNAHMISTDATGMEFKPPILVPHNDITSNNIFILGENQTILIIVHSDNRLIRYDITTAS
jgi:hypothetical protein